MPRATLFLDRDGVINERLPGSYVAAPKDFTFLPGVLDVWPRLNQLFGRVIIITNQQGIGKGLMTEQDLARVHAHLREHVELAGGRIDGIYYCPHLRADGCVCRKPRPGLVEAAMRDFPEIAPRQSLLAGDSLSDLRLGARLGMTSVWIKTKHEDFSAIAEAREKEEGFYISGELSRLADLPEWWTAGTRGL